jgi:superkiller protein 3
LRHHVALGHVLYTAGKYAGAADAYATAARIDPAWPGLQLVLSNACYSAGRLDDAERAAREALRMPTSPGWDALAAALRGQGKGQDSLAAAEEAVRMDSANLDAQNSLGAALLMLDRAQEALAVFDRLAAQGVDAPVLSLNRGDALSKLGRTSEARAVYDEAAQRWPHFPNLQQRLADRRG